MSLRTLALAGASILAITVGAASRADAAIQLGFILDDSGSIGSGNWNTIKNGLATAINTLVPLGSQYEVTVVTFSSGVDQIINTTLITDAASRTALANQIAGLSYVGGSTNYQAAFQAMAARVDANATAQYVNFATDGSPNIGTTDAATLQGYLTGAGVDNISIEGIGSGVNASYLQTICYPGPCTTAPTYNFPTQGFYIGVTDAAGYAAAIGEKIKVVTGQPIPEPMSLALFGLGLAGMGMIRRRKAA